MHTAPKEHLRHTAVLFAVVKALQAAQALLK
jgi:hypothetical protein